MVVSELRAFMVANDLTQADVAEVAMVSIKTVESWLASPDAASYRAMPARHLVALNAMLPKYLAARRRRKT